MKNLINLTILNKGLEIIKKIIIIDIIQIIIGIIISWMSGRDFSCYCSSFRTT